MTFRTVCPVRLQENVFSCIIIILLIFFAQGYMEKDKYIASQGRSVLSMFNFSLNC